MREVESLPGVGQEDLLLELPASAMETALTCRSAGYSS